jgi:hypothetical protein
LPPSLNTTAPKKPPPMEKALPSGPSEPPGHPGPARRLVARTHGEHDGYCGTGIWGILVHAADLILVLRHGRVASGRCVRLK